MVLLEWTAIRSRCCHRYFMPYSILTTGPSRPTHSQRACPMRPMPCRFHLPLASCRTLAPTQLCECRGAFSSSGTLGVGSHFISQDIGSVGSDSTFLRGPYSPNKHRPSACATPFKACVCFATNARMRGWGDNQWHCWPISKDGCRSLHLKPKLHIFFGWWTV